MGPVPAGRAVARPNAAFRRLWLATGVSQLGTQVSELAIPLSAITLLRASAFQVGLLAALGYLPLAIFGLPAGVWADRLPKRSVLITTDWCRAVVLASVPLAYGLWRLTIAQLDIVALLVGAFTVFFDVAYPSYVPSLATPAELPQANSRLQVSEQGAAVLGPAVAGWLIGAVGAPFAVLVDAASYVGSAAFVGRIRQRERRRSPDAGRPRMRRQVREGLHYVAREPRLRAIAVAAGLANLFGRAVVVIVLIYLARSARYSPTAIGVVFAVGSVGFLLGAALADRVIAQIGLGRTIVGGGCMAASSMLLLAAPPPAVAGPFVAAGMFVYGLGALTFTVGNATLRQVTAPPELLGRVTSSMRLLVWIAQPVAGILGGWLASRIGVHAALWAGAIGMLSAPLSLLASGVSSARMPEA